MSAARRLNLMGLVAAALAVGCVAGSLLLGDEPARSQRDVGRDAAEPNAIESKAAVKSLLRGRVVFVVDALRAREIKTYPEELKGQVVLETKEGDLLPILPDWRGRAFYQDERLRNRPVELIGYRRAGVPFLQVLTVFAFSEDGTRQYTDYWCDICAIPMYEIKPCDCCQQEIRLRFQPQELPEEFQEGGGEPATSSP